MNNDVTPIVVEKEGVSDNNYLITKIYFENGSKVEKGDLIHCMESSKVVLEIEAPSSGFIYYNVNEFDKVEAGQVIGAISSINEISPDWFDLANNKHPKKSTNYQENACVDIHISKDAKKLIENNNIDISFFANKQLVTKIDVENYLNSRNHHIISKDEINESSIFIYGGGGHAKMCIEILKQTKKFDIIGIVDANLPINSRVLDIPIIGNESIIHDLVYKGVKHAILGIGAVLNHISRNKLYLNLIEHRLNVPNIIHASASVEPSVQIGEGNQIMQGAIIGSNVKIGNNCIINSGAIISHDSVIGNNVHIAPGAIIGGGVSINDNTIVGMGATLFLGLKIGKNVVINNGINIFQNITDNEIVKC